MFFWIEWQVIENVLCQVNIDSCMLRSPTHLTFGAEFVFWDEKMSHRFFCSGWLLLTVCIESVGYCAALLLHQVEVQGQTTENMSLCCRMVGASQVER